MPPTPQRYLCRATTSVLLAVSVVSGGILLLGDRFGASPGYALRPPAVSSPPAACVDEQIAD